MVEVANGMNSYNTLEVLLLLQHIETTGPDETLRLLIYKRIHEIFVQDVESLRRVHLIGYNIGIIPECVKFVSSMRSPLAKLDVCIDLIPQIVRTDDGAKILFWVTLAAHLQAKYMLERTEKILLEVLQVVVRYVSRAFEGLIGLSDNEEMNEISGKLIRTLPIIAKGGSQTLYGAVMSILQGIIRLIEEFFDKLPTNSTPGLITIKMAVMEAIADL
jgi:hypothetical protein